MSNLKSQRNSPALRDDIDLTDLSAVETKDADYLFPARGGEEVDWGLALSGGGIRAGYFSLGAMKALYDKGLIDKIDVISSVSGGGYASYWLYTDYKKFGAGGKFGDSAFSDANFIQNICELQNIKKAGFVPTASLLKIIFNLRGRAFSRYKSAIEKSFGNLSDEELRENKIDKTPLDFLNNEIKNADVPYFIINTTLRLNKKEHLNPSLRLFEITPHFRGNPSLRYENWTDGKQLSLSESIAASAAPKWKIAHPVYNYAAEIFNKNTLYLSDGGHFENLAALALIRRKVKNIIIVDAEEDATYEFGAYTTLQKLLRDENIKINLQIPAIEDFLNKYKRCRRKNSKECKQKNRQYDEKKLYPDSVSIGATTSSQEKNDSEKTEIISRIYYIKMTMPEEIFPPEVLNRRKKERKEARENPEYQEWEKYFAQRLADRNKNGCSTKDLNFSADKTLYTQMYKHRVLTYSELINNPQFGDTPYLWGKMKFFETMSKIDPFFTYKFPHITTIDQSFLSDQAEAFVGLGYLQTSKMKIVDSEMR